ncbi:hypothetical protein CFC21_049861 [Triticum aestivum]|nr:uncharacterized protein LOC109740515 [Aegilops tauschii subsp. strangulata]XP_044359428.1 uncharacterized protein LOC123080559 [Triticum aestivum]KAF7039917.1 hypothetical protein CFC21_049861 [Triticum aestivum]
MAEEAAAPLLHGLPDEIVVWEILIRLDPKSLLRCRAVRRAWRCATSARRFLLAHHARQPTLPIVFGDRYRNILALDHRASADAQLHTIARLDEDFMLEASCDGLLLLSKFDHIVGFRTYLSVCNPATSQHASLRPLSGFDILGMYPHSPTGEYRLLLQRMNYMDSSEYQIGFYVFGLGSNEAPRYIGCSETKLALAFFNVPVRLRDSLHWYPLEYRTESDHLEYEEESKLVVTVFDTIAESFRQMRAPLVSTNSSIFKVDDMLGICNCNQALEIVDIWVLQDYQSEVWDLKYRIELRLDELTKLRGELEGLDGDGNWSLTAASGDGDVLLLVSFSHWSFGHWLFYVDTDGELVASFQDLYACKHRFKQTLVPHDLFTTLEGHAVGASPLI